MKEGRLLLPLDEARGMLAMGRTRFYELMAAGQIETVRVGRRRLVPRVALDEFVEALRSQSGTTR